MKTTVRDGLYRAAWILPVSSPPIANGFVRVREGVVSSFGRYSNTELSEPVFDLGQVAILPALVNAHTHLELSSLDSPIGYQGITLPDWVAEVLKHRQSQQVGPDARQKSIHKGLAESSAAGVGLVADIATPGSSLEDWTLDDQQQQPEIICLLEILGLSAERAAQCVEWAEGIRTEYEFQTESTRRRIEIGLSPHAPYSVPTILLERTMQMACKRHSIAAMHFAECEEEIELIENGTGPFRVSLEKIGVYRDGLFPVSGGMDLILRHLATAPRGLVIHGNYLSQAQIQFLADQKNLSVVYCPRTHAFFSHSRHPIRQLLDLGVRTVLGTDSRASNPDLSVWREAKFLSENRLDIAPEELLRMITVDAATALGRTDHGTIEIGAPARLIQVSLSSNSEKSEFLWDCLFEHEPKAIS